MSKYCPVTDSMVPYPVCKECDRTDCDKFTKIKKRLEEHSECVKEKYPFEKAEFFFSVLCGSQNYNLDGPDSDVDSKTVLLPSKKSLYVNGGNFSSNINCGNNEYSDAKDLHSYLVTVTKGNMNYLETLFSDYVFVNPIYKSEFNLLMSERNNISKALPRKVMNCVNGMAYSAYKERFNKETGSIKGKKIATILRLANFSHSYVLGENPGICFKSFPVFSRDCILSAKFRNEFDEKDLTNAMEMIERNYDFSESFGVTDISDKINDLTRQILIKRDSK